MTPPEFIKRPDGRLALLTETGSEPVSIIRCFPWTEGDRCLSFRDQEGNECLFLPSLDTLPAPSRHLVQNELGLNKGLFEIERIDMLKKEIELRCWEVTTRQGERSFQTELDEWPRELPDGTFLVEDLFGDLYVVPALENLDAASRKLFWPLVG